MKCISARSWLIAAVVVCATATSVQWSREGGYSVSIDQAEARVGRPATPVSAAGVARRTTRRAVVGGAAAAAGAAAVVAPACARVLVNGVWVCR